MCYHAWLHKIPICDLFNTKSQMFPFFIKKVHILETKSSLLCLFHNIYGKMTLHIFYKCNPKNCCFHKEIAYNK